MWPLRCLKLLSVALVFLYIVYCTFILLNPEYLSKIRTPIYIDPRKDGLKKIVLWNSWFSDNDWEVVKGKQAETIIGCGPKCVLSTIRDNPLRYDVLVFHGVNAQVPPRKRIPKQLYIILLHESPLNTWKHFIKSRGFYNWSATYSLTSDIPLPYLRFYKKKMPLESLQDKLIAGLPQMSHQRKLNEAMVAWVVSNCHTYSLREEYVLLLQDHIGVDVFGQCGIKCKVNCQERLFKTGRYKFYLSFENSACKDYFTEKVFVPLNLGWVPIVYGGLTGQDYLDYFPPHSFIDVRNFESPKNLAEYINYLNQNDTAYLEYFTWRSSYDVKIMDLQSAMCEICRAVQNVNQSLPSTLDFRDLWNPKTKCDINVINKIKGAL